MVMKKQVLKKKYFQVVCVSTGEFNNPTTASIIM